MKPRLDLRGHRFGRLVALQRILPVPPSKKHKWECLCDCGKKTIVNLGELRCGLTKSCGCLQKEKATVHGMYKTRVYYSWKSMNERCLNRNSPAYKHYGGRGIKICEEWLRLENFYRDMGERPENKTLDRIDNNGNYCKENCKWSTPKEQSNNKRDNHLLTYCGKTRTVSQWAEELNINRSIIAGRITRGFSIEKILTV